MSDDNISRVVSSADAEVIGILGTSLCPIPPPPQLRAHLLEEIERVPQEGAEDAEGAEGATPIMVPSEEETVALAPVSLMEEHRTHSRRRAPFARALARVAAAVVLLAAGVGIGRWTVMDDMEPTNHFAALNQMQDVERVEDTMPDGHVATLTWSVGMGMTAVTLPAEMKAEEGKELRVWARRDGEVRALGSYEPADGNDFAFIDVMPEPGLEVFITCEPRGEVSKPTGKPLVVMRISNQEETGDSDTSSGALSSNRTRA